MLFLGQSISRNEDVSEVFIGLQILIKGSAMKVFENIENFIRVFKQWFPDGLQGSLFRLYESLGRKPG